MHYFVDCIQRYADFKGRARRAEYWNYVLFYVILMVIIGIISAVAQRIGLVLDIVVSLGLLLPSLGVTIRRLHDTGRSGWWWFIGLVPAVGFIILLVFLCQDSQPGSNQWGPNPKESQRLAATPA